MTLRRVTLIGLLGLSLIAMWAVEASAHLAGYTLLPNGTRIHTSSVRCQFQAQTPGQSTGSTGLCEVFTTHAILFCINPSNNEVNPGESADLDIAFENFSAVASGMKQGGKSTWVVTAEAAGVASSDAECDASPACQELRQFCINPNWVPVKVIPVTMDVKISTFACTSTTACPCHPQGLDGLPLCLDHNPTPLPDGQNPVDPEAPPLTYSCELPVDPDDFNFGDILQYNCQLTPSG
jgi:hypothetical protein